MKRSDVPTTMVLRLALNAPPGTDLCEALEGMGVPRKVALAALYRDNFAGLLDYGVCVERSWITPEGMALIGVSPMSREGSLQPYLDEIHDQLRALAAAIDMPVHLVRRGGGTS